MTKWTPGRWEAADRGDYADFDGDSRVILGDDRRIAVVQHAGADDDEANTHLIAAAPDLYSRLLAANGALIAVTACVGEGLADELRHEIAKHRAVLDALASPVQP
jgi:hypothetical protein